MTREQMCPKMDEMDAQSAGRDVFFANDPRDTHISAGDLTSRLWRRTLSSGEYGGTQRTL